MSTFKIIEKQDYFRRDQYNVMRRTVYKPATFSVPHEISLQAIHDILTCLQRILQKNYFLLTV